MEDDNNSDLSNLNQREELQVPLSLSAYVEMMSLNMDTGDSAHGEMHTRTEDDEMQAEGERRTVSTPVSTELTFNNFFHISSATREFRETKENNFTKGCKWSPDGTCLLVASNDRSLRLFELPRNLYKGCVKQNDPHTELLMSVATRESGTIYDYCWFPKMASSKQETCWFLSTSQDVPIHLWDCNTGTLKASYRAYNQVDEVHAARSIAFDPSGEKIYSGFVNAIKIFDTSRPGRDFQTVYLKRPIPGMRQSRFSVVSSLAFNPSCPKIYGAGTYCKRIFLFAAEPENQPICNLTGQKGGLTHLQFSSDGMKLYSGARKDNEIIVWDLRWPGDVLCSFKRECRTSQRIYFEIDPTGEFLISGSTDGHLLVWNLNNPDAPLDKEEIPSHLSYHVHQDCLNGISIHPLLPVVATSSGQRHYPQPVSDSESEEFFTKDNMEVENSVKLWWCN